MKILMLKIGYWAKNVFAAIMGNPIYYSSRKPWDKECQYGSGNSTDTDEPLLKKQDAMVTISPDCPIKVY